MEHALQLTPSRLGVINRRARRVHVMHKMGHHLPACKQSQNSHEPERPSADSTRPLLDARCYVQMPCAECLCHTLLAKHLIQKSTHLGACFELVLQACPQVASSGEQLGGHLLASCSEVHLPGVEGFGGRVVRRARDVLQHQLGI